jgi:8-oxo-dGTP diphosphatase
VRVACGILRRTDGTVLIAQRPPGKLAAGAWEFPGGKIEPREAAEAALVRELEEELGVHVQQLEPFLQVTHAYRDRVVVLDAFLIDAFEGDPHGREGQALRWVSPRALLPDSLLAADWPIVLALRSPRHYVITPDADGVDALLAGLERLPRPCWLRLRQAQRSPAQYAAWARTLRSATCESGIALILDGDPERAQRLAADGWHAPSASLRVLTERPVPRSMIFAASVHDAVELATARRLGADAVVFGPIRETATHPGQPGVGWERLREAASQIACPLFAIGGLGLSDLPTARAAGAHGIAGISAYWSGSSESGRGVTGTL